MGFPDGSVDKESTYNAGDPGLIPGLGRAAGEGIGCPLQYYWVSLVAQLVKTCPNIKQMCLKVKPIFLGYCAFMFTHSYRTYMLTSAAHIHTELTRNQQYCCGNKHKIRHSHKAYQFLNGYSSHKSISFFNRRASLILK